MYTAVFLPNRVRNHCQMGMVNVAESWGCTVGGEGSGLVMNPCCPSKDLKDIPSLACGQPDDTTLALRKLTAPLMALQGS